MRLGHSARQDKLQNILFTHPALRESILMAQQAFQQVRALQDAAGKSAFTATSHTPTYPGDTLRDLAKVKYGVRRSDNDKLFWSVIVSERVSVDPKVKDPSPIPNCLRSS